MTMTIVNIDGSWGGIDDAEILEITDEAYTRLCQGAEISDLKDHDVVQSHAVADQCVPSYWVMRAPVLSTAHIEPETMRGLEHGAYGLRREIVLAIDGGALIYLFGGNKFDAAPKSLRDCVRWVRHRGFDWLRFDADGDKIPELPIYPWE